MKTLSVAIPTYEYNGLGTEVLEFNFNRLRLQNFKDFVVVISDNSADNKIEKLCDRWSDILDIDYYHNPIRGAATNSNNAIHKCKTEYIKFLCADDFLFDENSLRNIMEGFETTKANWLFTEYVHSNDRVSFYRHYVPQQLPNVFTNLLGTPSAMAMVNPRLLPALELFDPNLKYCYDVESFWRWRRVIGLPVIVNKVSLVNYIWGESVTSHIDQELINKENQYILHKLGAV